ncbi:uncharacterized protein LOC120314477 [Crotalus tigris]|uniref:uncharacterized protein LOC120314477 n=1 Tax=Crotalus tigris TaxID=88082 RepID=UPI00192F569C|nr:uncharacterized protein LOC120314477 [Crotalus tigris]
MRRRGPPRRNLGFRRTVLAHFSAMTQPFLFLLFLLTYFTGASTQFTMTQPPSMSASRGQTVHITCTREGGSISSYDVSCYQQKPGTKPQLVIYEDTSRPSGIPERFSGSVDSSSNSATMSISNVQSEDEADYYCLSYDSNYQSTVIPLYGELRQKPEGVSASLECFAPYWFCQKNCTQPEHEFSMIQSFTGKHPFNLQRYVFLLESLGHFSDSTDSLCTLATCPSLVQNMGLIIAVPLLTGVPKAQ